MEIDTPPRPTASSSSTLPPFTGTSSNLAPGAPPAELDFDASTFSPTAAFNLHRAREASPQPPVAPGQAGNNLAVAIVDDFADEDESLPATAPVAAGARRRVSRTRRAKRDSDGDATEDDEQDAGVDGRQLSKMASRLGGKGEFSFQVHHHHAPVGGAEGPGVAEAGKKWLHSGTPYVLLG